MRISSKKEEWLMKYAQRYHIIQQIIEGLIPSKEAAQLLNISLRHLKRLKKKLKELGPKALIHQNSGRTPPNAYPKEIQNQVLHLFKSKYHNLNISHFTDILKEEHNLNLSRETVRSWLIKAGLIKPNRTKYKRRKRRPRSEKEGQKVFLNGSLHPWFNNQESTLVLALNDATGKALYGLFVPRESVQAYFRLCYEVFSRYGLPQKFYLDRHSVFITIRHEGVHVKQYAKNPTAFQVAMAELGIGFIYAHSPEAKGRIERAFQTLQDRLVKELELQGIKDAERATKYFNEIFLPQYNKKFGVEPVDKEKAWREAPENLKEILSRRMERKVNKDLTISVKGKILQLKPVKMSLRLFGVKVEVREFFDGSYRIYHPSGEVIPYEEFGRNEKTCQRKKFRIKRKIKKEGDILPLQLG